MKEDACAQGVLQGLGGGEQQLLLQQLVEGADGDLEEEGEGEDAEVEAGIDAPCQAWREVGGVGGVGDGDACAEEPEQEGVEQQQGDRAWKKEQALHKAEEERADDGGCHEGGSVSLLQVGGKQSHAAEAAEQSEGGDADDLRCQCGAFLQTLLNPSLIDPCLINPCGQPQSVNTEHGGLRDCGKGQGDEEARVAEEARCFADLPCKVLQEGWGVRACFC